MHNVFFRTFGLASLSLGLLVMPALGQTQAQTGSTASEKTAGSKAGAGSSAATKKTAPRAASKTESKAKAAPAAKSTATNAKSVPPENSVGQTQTNPRATAAQPAVQRRVTMKPAGYHRPLVAPIPTDPRHPDYYEPTHRTILRNQDLPSRYDGRYGWRNPGGIGRMSEFYGPDNEFQNPGRPHVAATFSGTNGVVSRDQQIQMQALGNAKNQTMNNHIQAYGRPMGFYGYGYGGGNMYGAPY